MKKLLLEKYDKQTKGMYRILKPKTPNLDLIDVYDDNIRFVFDATHPNSKDKKKMTSVVKEIISLLTSLDIKVSQNRDIEKTRSTIQLLYPILEEE